ncbi:MAG TPA: cytochrome c [Gemmatimonadales bacterium]|nr:cytochrome c [Gemmatimonadales bacterium]
MRARGVGVAGVTVFVLTALSSGVAAQEAAGTFTVDASLAKRGQSVWNNRGCAACHAIGEGKRAGPDLAGVLERRDHGWLRRFLTNPPEMLETDSLARALLAEYNNTKMPNLRLKEPEIEAVLHYIAQQSEKAKEKQGGS